MKRIFLSSVSLLSFVIGLTTGLNAQVVDYGFSQSNETFTPISGGTVIGTATANTAAGSLDATLFQNQALEFPFFFNGASYSAINISCDGNITFGTQGFNTAIPISSATAYDGAISAWGRDINGVFEVEGQTSEIRMETIGTAPNREIVIQWSDFRPLYTTVLTNVYTFSFQIRLLETSNVVKVVYGPGSFLVGSTPISSTVTLGPQVGLRGATNADFNNRTGLSWLASDPGVTNNNRMAFSTTDNFPASGLTYAWAPAACSSPGSLAVTGLSLTSADVTWGTNPDFSQWNVEWGAPGFAPGTGNEIGSDQVSANNFTITGLLASTNYQFYVQTDCGTDGLSNWAGPLNIFTGYCSPVNTSTSDYTSKFETFTATQNLLYTATSFTGIQGYSDLTATDTIVHFENDEIEFETNFQGGANTIRIWVDWNNNLVFDENEEVFLGYVPGAAPLNPQFGSFVIPAGTPVGSYRLRIRSRWSTTVPGPCDSQSFGTTQDFILTVIAPPTCPRPLDLTASMITSSSADISWTLGGTEDLWELEYGEAGFAQGSGTSIIVNAVPYELTGLDENTTYQVYVRAICGAGDTSTWRGPTAFTTLCNVFVAPYIENFDGAEWVSGTGFNNAGAIISDCWANDPSASPAFFWGTKSGITSNSTTTGPATDKSGNGNYIFTEASNGTTFAGLVATFDSPAIDLSQISDPYLGFSYFMRGADVDSLNVLVSNDYGTTWNDLAVIIGQQQFQLTDPWKDTIISLAAYENEIVMIRFQNIKNASFNDDVAIDDFFILPCVGNPGTGSSTDVCILDANVSLPSLATINQVGGEWIFPQNPIYVVNNETFNYSVLPYGSYNVYYKVPGACSDDSLTVTITIAPPSSAGQSASLSNCNNGFINLFDGITGLVDLTGTWYTPGNQPLTSALINVNGQLPGVYNYYYIASNGICPADTSFAEVTLIDCASIEENNLAGFELYPNPTENHVFITYKGEAIHAEVYVNDSKGSVIYSQNRAFETNSTLEVDLSNVQAGAYIVTIMSEGRRTTMHLIKQ